MNELMQRRRQLMSANRALLPVEYQQVAWFQTTESYSTKFKFETDALPKTTRRYEVDAKVDSDTSSLATAILACVHGNNKFWQIVTNVDNPYFIFQAGGSYVGDVLKDNNRHLFVLDGLHGRCWVDNSTPLSIQVSDVDSTEFYVGSRQGVVRFSAVTFFSMKVYENDVLINYLLPCYLKSNGKNKLYDLVSKTAIGDIVNVNRGPNV